MLSWAWEASHTEVAPLLNDNRKVTQGSLPLTKKKKRDKQ